MVPGTEPGASQTHFKFVFEDVYFSKYMEMCQGHANF